MNWVPSFVILVSVCLVVFAQVRFDGWRDLFSTQMDLLPAIMVYAGLNSSIWLIMGIAMVGGLLLDSFSANPLGATVLPLFLVGFIHYQNRPLLLKGNAFAQAVLGASASATTPLLTILIILALGDSPILGLGFVLQLVLVSVFGGLMTPLLFVAFGKIQKTFEYQPAQSTSFRPDREIKRGRF